MDLSSQFKNKFVFAILPNFYKQFELNIKWSYFKTSHGKGPNDALGRNAKKVVRRLVLTRRAVIRNATSLKAALEMSDEVYFDDK